MKTQPAPFPRTFGHPGPRSGVALISVLAVILLLTILVVTFLIRAEMARSSSASYRATTDTRLLSDTVVNLVQAEINDATTYGSTGTTGQTTGTGPYTWASQPGAIRTYDSTGTLQKIYRLYSAPSLTTTKVSELLDASGNTVEVPATWSTSPAQWVDLNAPVSVTGMTDSSGASVASYSIYPILDPRDPASIGTFLTSAKMPGFGFDKTKVTTTTANPAPMPVQWLYVLKKGQIAPVTGVSGTTATFTAPNAPTADNPIVGRIAFWTDDESCKVNINTAAGAVSARNDPQNNGTTKILPAPWDVPRFAGSWDDLKMMAESQPVAGEYQRYPGHPATTLLYPTLNGLNFSMPEITNLNTSNSYPLGYTPGTDTQNGGTRPTGTTSALYNLLPRYNDDYGSQAGIANTTGTYYASSAFVATPISAKRNRLYTSLGELLYTPARTRNNITTPAPTGLTRQQIETGKFFLTAHSRSPEVTLFGTPRVTLWPVPDTAQKSSWQTNNQTQTAIDQMIAFCSTTSTGSGGTPSKYYFQRFDSMSAANDWTNEPRNQALYGYLQDLTSANIPGYGGNFLSKYLNSNIASIANERDQILTEMVDYIRCTNLNDHGNPTGVNFATRGEVVPLKINSLPSGSRTASTTYGLGRLPTLSEIGLHVICTADGTNNLATLNTANPNPGYSGTGNTATSVVYNPPQTVTGYSSKVSPVKGSANDPAYVSNLPEDQYLRDASNNIVDVYGNQNAVATTPFSANPTLTTTGSYGDPLAALPIGSKKLQAMLLFEVASPMNGYDIMSRQGGQGPDVNIHVTNIENIAFVTNIGINPLITLKPFPSRTDTSTGIAANTNGNGYLNGFGITPSSPYGWSNNGDSNLGGILGFRFPLTAYSIGASNIGKSLRYNSWSGKGPLTGTGGDTLGTGAASRWTANTSSQLPYRFVSNPFTVTTANMQISSAGMGTFNVALEVPQTLSSATHIPYQNFTISFPIVVVKTPTLPAYGFRYTNSSTMITHAPDWWSFDNRIGWCNTGTSVGYVDVTSNMVTATPNISLGCVIRGDNDPPANNWAVPTGTAWSYKSTTGTTGTPNSVAGMTTGATNYGDLVRSIIPIDGDYRITMAKNGVNADTSILKPDFIATPLYTSPTLPMTHLLMEPRYSQGTTGVDRSGKLVSGATYGYKRSPKVTSTLSGTTPDPQKTWDWDSGGMTGSDGAYSGKADEGNVYSPNPASGNTNIPYTNDNNSGTSSSYFTANRMISSAVAFGSLPTGVAENIPWRTLLFRPQLGRTSPALQTPKDSLLLDLFTMPVVQPYSISEPFSTAGKVNMNYQIVPFTYINRSTALQAVLGSEMIARIPTADANNPFNEKPYYQGGYVTLAQTNRQNTIISSTANVGSQAPNTPIQARLPLNLSDTNGTLRQFKEKFTNGDIFRSPAEICDIYMVPVDYTNTSMYSTWTSNALADAGWYSSDFGIVGDNVREHPYGTLYPRLTTKSNTYTVYYKVQVLKNPSTSDQTQWNESTGVVNGEYRASTTLERYLDPNNNAIPDYTDSTKNPAVTSTAPGLDTFYQWRVVANTAFAP